LKYNNVCDLYSTLFPFTLSIKAINVPSLSFYVALIGRNDLKYVEGTTDDLLQQGKDTFWITEMGSKRHGILQKRSNLR
jgi:hypothetical protein